VRRRLNETELGNLLRNAHGIDVRLWVVELGVFEGIVFDSDLGGDDLQKLIEEQP